MTAPRALRAIGIGFGGAFFVCCVLPVVVALVAGAAVAAPLALLDDPVILAVGTVVGAVFAWLYLRHRAHAGIEVGS